MEPIKSHTFTSGGGNEITDGKSHWPDCLNLHMPRRDAWHVVESLMRQLQDESNQEIVYSTCGKLDYNEEEETLAPKEASK